MPKLDEVSKPWPRESGEPGPAGSLVVQEDKPVGFVSAPKNIERRQIPVEVAAKMQAGDLGAQGMQERPFAPEVAPCFAQKARHQNSGRTRGHDYFATAAQLRPP